MIKCEICTREFLNNLDGSLTKHLLDEHHLTLEQYIIKFQYNNNPPKCQCGLCDDLPKFYRGKYKKFAFGHNREKDYIKLYIKKYGEPICEVCGKLSGFNRKKPKRYCSFKCQGIVYGFSLKSTQETIHKNIQKKYGVNNVSELEFVKNKLSISLTGKCIGRKDTIETREKKSIAAKKMWNTPNIRKKLLKSFHSKLFMEKRMIHLKDNIKKHSKLHENIRTVLNLDSYNFIPEKIINNYIVDEYNEDKKIILEINGDYVHANPKIYKSNDIIKLYGVRYTAQEKWESDKLKKDNLERLGYTVIVIWESDNIEEKKKEIELLTTK